MAIMCPARRYRANDAVEKATAAATAVLGAPTMAEVSEVHKQLSLKVSYTDRIFDELAIMRPARRSRANDAVENTTAAATAVVGAPAMAEVSKVHKQLAASNIDTVLPRGSKDLGTADGDHAPTMPTKTPLRLRL